MIKIADITNFCGIEYLQLEFKKFNVFDGLSMQGKSTILQAIKWAIFGSNDDSLVRTGADECEVIVHTDDGTKIERRLAIGGTSKLYVYDEKGHSIPKPQEHLKQIFNLMAFDPTSMLSMDDKAIGVLVSKAISQRLELGEEELKKYYISHLKLGDDPVLMIKSYYDTLFKERTEVNKGVKEGEVKTRSIKPVDETVLAEIKTQLATAESELQTINLHNAKVMANQKHKEIKMKNDEEVKRLEHQLSLIPAYESKLEEVSMKLKELTEELSKEEQVFNDSKTNKRNIEQVLNKLEGDNISCPLDASIKCTTNIKAHAEKLKEFVTNRESEIEFSFKKIQSLKEKIEELKKILETDAQRKSLSVSHERALSISKELKLFEGEIIDTKDKQEFVNKRKEEIGEMEATVRYNKMMENEVSTLKKKVDRQAELNKILEALNELINIEIPSKLKLNVTGMTLENGQLRFRGLPLSRQGDSYKLRLCTALLKDLYPAANIFMLDRSECIDSAEFKKYAEKCASGPGDTQYFAAYVGSIRSEHPGVKVTTMEGFKVKV
jgi:DNA repair ATPase RecN